MSWGGALGRGRRGVFERDDCGGDGEKQKVEEEEELEVGERLEREKGKEKKKREIGKIREDPALT